jgi:hypothetical protein
MPDKANVELDSAGRCLAFGLFTASGFHICRAVESVMEDYYGVLIGEAKQLHSWNEYIKRLQAAIDAGIEPMPDRTTVRYLDNLRQSSRNPIMHPRVVLEEADAIGLFDLCRGVILRMAKELSWAYQKLPLGRGAWRRHKADLPRAGMGKKIGPGCAPWTCCRCRCAGLALAALEILHPAYQLQA